MEDSLVRTYVGATVAIGLSLAAAQLSVAATRPQPYQWTPAQAAAAIKADGKGIFAVPNTGQRVAVVATTCRGVGTRVAGRFTKFRCPTVFEPSGPEGQEQENRATIWAKTRKSGGLCWSLESLAAVPSGCLGSGPRARGSTDNATLQLRLWLARKYGGPSPWQGDVRCNASGSGFYLCTFAGGPITGSASVKFTTPRSVVVVQTGFPSP